MLGHPYTLVQPLPLQLLAHHNTLWAGDVDNTYIKCHAYHIVSSRSKVIITNTMYKLGAVVKDYYVRIILIFLLEIPTHNYNQVIWGELWPID